MTYEQFCYWLLGFSDATNNQFMPEMVRDQLEDVLLAEGVNADHEGYTCVK